MTVQFDAGSWGRAADAFDEAAAAVRGLKPTITAAGGPSPVDAAVADVARRATEGFAKGAQGLAGGLSADAAGMRDTGSTYSAQEKANTQLGSTIGGR